MKSIKRSTKELTEKHKRDLRVIQKLCLPDDDPVSARQNPDGTWFLIFDKRLIAFGLVVPSRQLVDTAYLSRCCVYPSHRGQGIQRRLIRSRERYMRSQGYTWMITDTSTDNPASSNSLLKCGYKIIYPTKPWANSNSIYWTKKL